MSMIGSPMPNASRAQISPAKLRDYVLNPHHPRGAHKARVFVAALSIGRADWADLMAQPLAGARTAPVVSERADHHRTRYEVSIDILGRNGRRAPVTTAWFAVTTDNAPRVVSAYVDVSRSGPAHNMEEHD
jgi:hypothetical protein